MGIQSELKFDNDKCVGCGCILSGNIDKIVKLSTNIIFEGELADAIFYKITCANCGEISKILYQVN